VTGEIEWQKCSQAWDLLSRAAAKPEMLRDALRYDPGLVSLLVANERFLQGFYRSSAPLLAILDAIENLKKEEVDIDGLVARINAGPEKAAESPGGPCVRLASELRKFAEGATTSTKRFFGS